VQTALDTIAGTSACPSCIAEVQAPCQTIAPVTRRPLPVSSRLKSATALLEIPVIGIVIALKGEFFANLQAMLTS